MSTKIISHTIVAGSTVGPVKVDYVRVELDYWEGEADGEPSGWHVDVRLKGWPLTKVGTRDKRINQHETVYYVDGADADPVLHEAVKACYDMALREGNIDSQTVLGDDGEPGTTLTLL